MKRCDFTLTPFQDTLLLTPLTPNGKDFLAGLGSGWEAGMRGKPEDMAVNILRVAFREGLSFAVYQL